MDTITGSAQASLDFLLRNYFVIIAVLVLTLVLMVYLYLVPNAWEFFVSGSGTQTAPARKEGSAAAVVA